MTRRSKWGAEDYSSSLRAHLKCPPAFLHAVMEADGVTVVWRVKVAPHVIVLVVVAQPILRRVFVGVGNVVV